MYIFLWLSLLVLTPVLYLSIFEKELQYLLKIENKYKNLALILQENVLSLPLKIALLALLDFRSETESKK